MKTPLKSTVTYGTYAFEFESTFLELLKSTVLWKTPLKYTVTRKLFLKFTVSLMKKPLKSTVTQENFEIYSTFHENPFEINSNLSNCL